MLRHLAPLLIPTFVLGCGTVPAASVEVTAPAATGGAMEEVAPMASATVEAGSSGRKAKALAAKRVLAACKGLHPALPCSDNPLCTGPWDPPKTLKENECWQFVAMGLGDPSDPEPAAGPPCILLRAAALIDEMIEANDTAKVTLPELVASMADYRAALLEHSNALKDMADAKVQGDTPRVAADQLRIRRALRLEDEASGRHGRACMN
jgi:hypothetical protein